MRFLSNIRMMLLFTVIIGSTSCQQYPRRTLRSSQSFTTYTVYFKHIMGNSSDNIQIPTSIGSYLNGSNYLSFFQGFNGIFHYSNFSGYQMVSYLKNITATSVSIEFLAGFCKDICIANYYHYQVTLLLIPNQAPFRRQFTPTYPYPSVVGYPNSIDYIQGYAEVWFQITDVFQDACYYDSQKKIKDKISIWHTFNANAALGVMDLQAVSPTGSWQFDFSNNDTYIVYNITFGAYYADIQYITAVVIGWCPNSYVFSNFGTYIYSNPRTVLQMPANTQGSITQIRYSQSVSITNMPAFTFSYLKMDLMSTTLAFSSAFFNVTPFYDTNGSNIPNSLRFWFINNMPNTSKSNYMILGSYGGCYKNFQIYNNTHCFCNQSAWLYYKPQIDYSSCILLCPSSMYSPSGIQTCLNCNSTFGFGCQKCSEASCQKCISTLILFVNGSFSACYNCSNLFGIFCSKCNNIQCFSCFSNYFISNNSCKCFGDRFQSSNGACYLCNYTYLGCKTCNQYHCSQCQQNFTITNGSCICNNNFVIQENSCICPTNTYLFKNNSCQICSKYYSGCVTCTDNGCNSCKLNYIFTIGQCECTGDRYITNNSCFLCSDTYSGCIICNNNGCLQCAQNFILSNLSCVCLGPLNLLVDVNSCQTCFNQIQGCIQCVNSSNCSLCSNGYRALSSSGKNLCECISNFYINKTCIICNIYYGFGCKTCFDGCLTCIQNYAITNISAINIFNPCQPCSLLYTNCFNCNSNACTQCLPTFILAQGSCVCPSNATNINNICFTCTNLFKYCISCSSFNCKSCLVNFIITNNQCTCSNDRYLSNSTCILCQDSFPHCSNCTGSICFYCFLNYLLINNRCLCSGTDRFEQNNQCILCLTALKGCLQCSSQSSCWKCISPNYTLINGICQCSFGYGLADKVCLLCSDLFGQGCYLCNQTNCTLCKQGFSISSYNYESTCLSCSLIDNFCYQCSFQNGSKCTQCMYNFTKSTDQQACLCSDSRLLIQNRCILCKDLYVNCRKCNQIQCVQCNQGFQNNQYSCVCKDTQYEFAQTCLPCTMKYSNCLKCNFKECYLCKYNFTYYNGECICMAPRIYNALNQTCNQCSSIYGSNFCEFRCEVEWMRIGNIIYFRLGFNRPLEQINFAIPVRYNLKIRANNKSIPIQDFGQIMRFRVNEDINEQTISIIILEKDYIKWKTISLSSDLSPISVKYKHTLIPQQTLSYFFQYLSLTEKLLIGIGAGSTNMLFQQTRIISLIIYSTNIQDNCQIIAFRFLHINQNGQYKATDSLKEYIFGLKQSSIKHYSNHLLLGLLSSFILIYIRGYIKSKRSQSKNSFFRMFKIYWIQLLVENNISLMNSLSFIVVLEIKNLIQLNRQITNEQILCGGISIGILALYLILCLILLKQLNDHGYYGWLKIDQTYKKIIYFFDLIRPLIISILLGFFSQSPIIRFAILAINCLKVIYLFISTIYCLNKLIIIIKISKSALSLFLTIQTILTDNSESILSTISYFFAVIIPIIEIIQMLSKIILISFSKNSLTLDKRQSKQKQVHQIQLLNKPSQKQAKKDIQMHLSDLLKIKQDLTIIKMQNKKRKNK